ncbi:MAG TPA: hypothetical protein VHV51_23400 [Polyangiaceae bacterium]|jgi:hypothetical protein|nr:hypothetical protein [Polyangiaceae bacterium]
MNRLGRVLQQAALFAFFLVLICAALTARVISEGNSELAASDVAFNDGDLRPALEHARRAATLYAPGAPHVQRAYERLIAIALGAEAAGDAKTAFAAWQAVRAAALESRHVWVAHAAELERANQNLARLEALARSAADADQGKLERQALSRLSADSAPDPAWIAVLGTGFLLALAGLALFAFQGLDKSGKISLRRAQLGILLFAIGAACWTLAAYKA